MMLKLFIIFVSVQIVLSKPQISYKNGNVGVNFGGYHAAAGLGGLLSGNAADGGLHASAGTPFGQRASAGLGESGGHASASSGTGYSASAGFGRHGSLGAEARGPGHSKRVIKSADPHGHLYVEKYTGPSVVYSDHPVESEGHYVHYDDDSREVEVVKHTKHKEVYVDEDVHEPVTHRKVVTHSHDAPVHANVEYSHYEEPATYTIEKEHSHQHHHHHHQPSVYRKTFISQPAVVYQRTVIPASTQELHVEKSDRSGSSCAHGSYVQTKTISGHHGHHAHHAHHGHHGHIFTKTFHV